MRVCVCVTYLYYIVQLSGIVGVIVAALWACTVIRCVISELKPKAIIFVLRTHYIWLYLPNIVVVGHFWMHNFVNVQISDNFLSCTLLYIDLHTCTLCHTFLSSVVLLSLAL